ncbi:MAG: hypothetical protein QM582_14030 [Micropruina sp.]|uniref:hypothetical protein n=1 Tax=Micropruina sp. TaxID=2737536 RepID=UPI0039E654CF
MPKAAHAIRPLHVSPYPRPEGDRDAVPSTLSPIPAGTDIAEAELGGEWLQLGLFPQGRETAGVLNALDAAGHPLYPTVVVEMARRSSKTTAVLNTLLGRCLNRPDYKVVNTAQDGQRARNKLREVMRALEKAGFERRGVGKLYWSNGQERIEFTNGSSWIALPPDPSAFRGEASDAILIDEAGELPPEKADGLLAGVLPLMDTRPDGQVVIAGTPNPEQRAGLLWSALEDLAKGVPGTGGVVYAAADTDRFADLSDPDNPVYNLDLLRRTHPGISCGLTTIDRVLSRIGPMGIAKWCAEYLCQWPRAATASALDVEAWLDCASPDPLPPRPDRVGLAFDVAKDRHAAALVAAWRDDAGRAHLEVVACRPGTDWLPAVARAAYAKHRPPGGIAHDPIGGNADPADRMARGTHRVPLHTLTVAQLVGAADRVDAEISRRNIVHYDQPDLTEAVETAAWRPFGRNGRLFLQEDRPQSFVIVAASAALWAYDKATKTANRRRIVSSARLLTQGAA